MAMDITASAARMHALQAWCGVHADDRAACMQIVQRACSFVSRVSAGNAISAAGYQKLVDGFKHNKTLAHLKLTGKCCFRWSTLQPFFKNSGLTSRGGSPNHLVVASSRICAGDHSLAGCSRQCFESCCYSNSPNCMRPDDLHTQGARSAFSAARRWQKSSGWAGCGA
eukprot:6211378-Pleurochrysis_carterae.AAC.2